jgi:L-cysteine desulfidase
VAYAASLAGAQLTGVVSQVQIWVDPGVYKNGMAVAVPNTGGERGNLIAGVLGAFIRQPDLKMKIMGGATAEQLEQAKALIAAKKATLDCDKTREGLYIEVLLHAGEESARAVIEGSHTHVLKLEYNGKSVAPPTVSAEPESIFRKILAQASMAELVDWAEQLSPSESAYIQQGIEMNLRASDEGMALQRVGHYIAELMDQNQSAGGVSAAIETVTASAADARMGGLNLPVMSSGGSGNQGIVAILVPYLVGRHYSIDNDCIIRSIALSHLVNSYIKCFTGELSPLCGCAISAGVGAAISMVYQQAGKDLPKMALAANNLISDLGGMLCDGAKEGCALKVASSTSSAIRAAHMALNNHGISHVEGFVGVTVEETIRNLGRIGLIGMSRADGTMLDIMIEKAGI